MAGGDDDQFNQLRHDLNSLEESEEIIFTCSEESSFSDEDELKVSINKEDLSIKNLKIPKTSSGEEERMMIRDGRLRHHHHHLASSEFPRICKVCKKGFSSGKALGGHSRIHAQPKKQSLLIKRTLKFKKHHHHHHHHHQSPGTPTTSTSTSTDCCNPNNGGRSSSSSSSMMKKMYNNNTCWVCEKSFPSEKSLFGHMRCHPDRTWRGIQPPNLPPTTVNKNMSSSSTISEAEAIPRHKLDDHIDSATTTTIHPSVVVDLSRSLSGWSSTAKRGRKGTLSNSAVGSGCPSGLDEQIPEDVVQNLMMLAQGHKSSINLGLPSNKQPQQQLHQRVNIPKVTTMVNSSLTNMMPKNDPQIEQVSGSKKTTKQRIEASLPVGGYGYPAKKLKIEEEEVFNIMDKSSEIPVPLNNIDTGDSKDTDDFSASGDQLIYSCYRIINLKKKKRRTLKFRDLDTVGGFDQSHSNNPTVTTTDRYKCTTCNKTFPTHQALGGHRSSHNKVKNTPALVKDESAYAAHGLYADAEGERHHPNIHASAQVGQTEDEEAPSSRLHHGGGPHQCKVCNKTFATGQALGGHKRCHWTGPIETPSSQVGSSGEASHTSHRIPAFDLNELPAMEDEEGVESVFAQPQHSAG